MYVKKTAFTPLGYSEAHQAPILSPMLYFAELFCNKLCVPTAWLQSKVVSHDPVLKKGKALSFRRRKCVAGHSECYKSALKTRVFSQVMNSKRDPRTGYSREQKNIVLGPIKQWSWTSPQTPILVFSFCAEKSWAFQKQQKFCHWHTQGFWPTDLFFFSEQITVGFQTLKFKFGWVMWLIR